MATVTIDVNDLPGRYAEAVSRAERGEEVLVTAAGQHPVRLVPVPRPAERPVVLGLHAGLITVPPDFDDPLPPECWTDAVK